VLVLLLASITHAGDAWLDLSLKARSLLVDPVGGARHEVMDPIPTPIGLRSPDGSRVAFVGSTDERVGEGHDFDLFIAAVDSTQPSGKGESRRVTTRQKQPSALHWLPDSSGVVFLAEEGGAQGVWFASVDATKPPVRISEGRDRCTQLAVLPSGKVAYVQMRRQHRKQVFADLVLQPPTADAERTALVRDRFVAAFAVSPDERTLAWGEPGSIHLVDLVNGSSREIPSDAIHPQLPFHMPREMAWSPDSRLLAATLAFAGGVARGPGSDPNEPWPKQFAEDKVFIVPRSWVPPADQVKGAASGASSQPDESKPLPAPPAGDRSKPWWIDGVPMRPIEIRWIDEREVRQRVSAREHAE